MDTRIAVIHYSATGNVHLLRRALAKGVLPLGYTEEIILKRTGNPYGSTWVSRKGSSPDEDALAAARAQGRRLADVTKALKAGMNAGR
jgi:hypothetical protein